MSFSTPITRPSREAPARTAKVAAASALAVVAQAFSTFTSGTRSGKSPSPTSGAMHTWPLEFACRSMCMVQLPNQAKSTSAPSSIPASARTPRYASRVRSL